jgi:uncharacterized protein YdeI (YjbR/CyaY-like superfamily)
MGDATGTDPRVDAYIAEAEEFARPILAHVRALVHAACPSAEETIKWGFPHFMYGGAILCGMAAFKQHCAIDFRLGELMEIEPKNGKAMGQLGRIAALRDLPSDRRFTALVKHAVELADSGAKRPSAQRARGAARALALPDDLLAALNPRKNARARAAFDALSPSHRNEYVEWITEAKRPETRARRIATTLEWLAEGKSRNWKYS